MRGGEPDDRAVKARVLTEGTSEGDLLGFYVLRSIPQWIGEQKIVDAGDARLKPFVEAELEKSRAALGVSANVLGSANDWFRWYLDLNVKPLGADFVTEEVGPLADGRFATNRIGHAISRARDSHLHQLIVNHLNAGESVLVVYGASHLMIQRPALDAALGRPCYVGADLKHAAAMCS